MTKKTEENKIFLERWNSLFDELPDSKINFIRENIYTQSFEVAKEINKYGFIFPGLIRIKKGKVRCIFEINNEPLMLISYKEGEIFGEQHILSNIQEQIFVSSTFLELEIIPVNILINLLEEYPNLNNKFAFTSIPEIFSCLYKSSEFKNLSKKKILMLAKKLFNENNKIEQKISFANTRSAYIACSDNFKYLKKGDFIESNSDLTSIGKIGKRIIKLPNKELNFEEINKEKLSNINDTKNIEEKIKKETLQEWYGKIGYNKYPHFISTKKNSQLFICLKMLAIFYEIPFQRFAAKRLISKYFERSKQIFINDESIKTILEVIGLTGTILKPKNIDQFKRTPLPALIFSEENYQIIWEFKNGNFLVGNPLYEQKWVSAEEIFSKFDIKFTQNILIEHLPSNKSFKFGFQWFLPSLKKYKFALLQVVISSFFVQLLALFNPLLIQQIIDTVISKGNVNALNILGLLLLIMSFSQGLLGTLRTYLFSDVTNRIDISLGSKIIKHLYKLPLSYFAKRRIGEVSSRISELEKIRSFMTGTALTITLDALFSIIYIFVMMLYSVKLTLISMSVIPFFILLTIFVSPIAKRHLRDKAEYNAKVQSHLVESINGIETIKGQSLEMQSEMRWENLYSKQINAGFKNTMASVAAGSTNQFLQQLSGLIIIWIGAGLVLEGKLTLGGLIAFRILSGYVTNPILRLANLWQNFQETSLALERLSDIVDSRNEKEIQNENLPFLSEINEKISFKNVSFKFDTNSNYLLKNINAKFYQGEFIGIVGKSGSGKSTLMKLMMGFYKTTDGEIYIDDNDISKINLNSLRSQIGYVPQDTIIFDGSITQNIALTKPDASFEEIKEAANISCASEFINNLPHSFSSYVGEKGCNLSGGQRQRIGLARVLITKPKILILDESTSALDILLEKKIINNLMNLSYKLIIIFITHRVYSLKKASNIFVIENGKFIESGSHSSLINKNGKYKMLHDLNKF